MNRKMIGRICSVMLAACVVWLATSGEVSAQRAYTSSAAFAYAGSGSSPLSPYMNLNRPGASVADNYYNLVRPQINAQRQFNYQQSQINSLQRDTTAGYQALNQTLTQMSKQNGQQMGTANAQGGVTRPTGHQTVYGNTSHFYGGRR